MLPRRPSQTTFFRPRIHLGTPEKPSKTLSGALLGPKRAPRAPKDPKIAIQRPEMTLQWTPLGLKFDYFGASLSSSRRRRRRPKEQHHEGTKHTYMEKNTEETLTTPHLLVLSPKRKSHTHRYMWLPLRGLLSFGARRLSRSDWDPARAENEAKAHSAVWKQTLAWSRLGRKRSLASLIGGAQSDDRENTVN